jgi:hypothetical protein
MFRSLHPEWLFSIDDYIAPNFLYVQWMCRFVLHVLMSMLRSTFQYLLVLMHLFPTFSRQLT